MRKSSNIAEYYLTIYAMAPVETLSTNYLLATDEGLEKAGINTVDRITYCYALSCPSTKIFGFLLKPIL